MTICPPSVLLLHISSQNRTNDDCGSAQFLLGVANAFDFPARQSLITELVDREDMTNAIALNGRAGSLIVRGSAAVRRLPVRRP